MALLFKAIESKTIKVISQKDECLQHVTTEVYSDYLKSLDETLLNLKPEDRPTYFHLKTVATQKDILKQKNNMASLAMKAQNTGDMPIFSLMYNSVKTGLIDMITDGVSSMPKNNDGTPTEDFMTWLISTDILTELFTALENQKSDIQNLHLTKKK